MVKPSYYKHRNSSLRFYVLFESECRRYYGLLAQYGKIDERVISISYGDVVEYFNPVFEERDEFGCLKRIERGYWKKI